jgi:hypothetical protein
MTQHDTRPAIPEPTATVVQYSVSCLPRRNPNYRHYVVSVIEREIGRWVVRAEGEIRDSNGDPIQPMAEGDDVAAWAAGHRFDLDTALALARRIAPTLVVNGYTVADALKMGGRR